MYAIATDLDRTLFPNGNQPYDNSMPLFKKILQEKDFQLIYVTGRNLQQIQDGIQKYDPPLPNYAIAEVGTKIYLIDGKEFKEDSEYVNILRQNTKNWDIPSFKKALKDITELRLQEDFNQNEFKLSYYIDRPKATEKTISEIKEITQKICTDAQIIYSIDETRELGLLDVLPIHADKMQALEYLRKKLDLDKDHIIYCGDSGNDIAPLTFGYRAILVRNAIDEVRNEVLAIARRKKISEKIFTAQGNKQLNGRYVSGIIEGLQHFKIIK